MHRRPRQKNPHSAFSLTFGTIPTFLWNWLARSQLRDSVLHLEWCRFSQIYLTDPKLKRLKESHIMWDFKMLSQEEEKSDPFTPNMSFKKCTLAIKISRCICRYARHGWWGSAHTCSYYVTAVTHSSSASLMMLAEYLRMGRRLGDCGAKKLEAGRSVSSVACWHHCLSWPCLLKELARKKRL